LQRHFAKLLPCVTLRLVGTTSNGVILVQLGDIQPSEKYNLPVGIWVRSMMCRLCMVQPRRASTQKIKPPKRGKGLFADEARSLSDAGNAEDQEDGLPTGLCCAGVHRGPRFADGYHAVLALCKSSWMTCPYLVTLSFLLFDCIVLCHGGV